jgi:hypothetical protein
VIRSVPTFLAGVILLAAAIPVLAADPQLCVDPNGVEVPFACGELGVTLREGVTESIEAVLARSAPEATVTHRAADVQPPGTVPLERDFRTYALEVPSGEEIRLRDRLAADPAVEEAQLVHLGSTTPPDSAMDPADRRPSDLTTLGFALLGAALVSTRLTRSIKVP